MSYVLVKSWMTAWFVQRARWHMTAEVIIFSLIVSIKYKLWPTVVSDVDLSFGCKLEISKCGGTTETIRIKAKLFHESVVSLGVDLAAHWQSTHKYFDDTANEEHRESLCMQICSILPAIVRGFIRSVDGSIILDVKQVVNVSGSVWFDGRFLLFSLVGLGISWVMSPYSFYFGKISLSLTSYLS